MAVVAIASESVACLVIFLIDYLLLFVCFPRKKKAKKSMVIFLFIMFVCFPRKKS